MAMAPAGMSMIIDGTVKGETRRGPRLYRARTLRSITSMPPTPEATRTPTSSAIGPPRLLLPEDGLGVEPLDLCGDLGGEMGGVEGGDRADAALTAPARLPGRLGVAHEWGHRTDAGDRHARTVAIAVG